MTEPATRPSTLAGVLDDKSGLEPYYVASALRTISKHEDLLARLSLIKDEGWKSYKPLYLEARKRGGSPEASKGTNIHMMVEALHSGMDTSRVPEPVRSEGQAVWELIHGAGFTVAHSEKFLVCVDLPELAAGTTDLILRYGDHRFIADIKSVNELNGAKYGSLSWGIQTAVYSHGFPYNGEPDRDYYNRPLIDHSLIGFWPMGEQPERDVALVIQIQRGTKKVMPIWIDLKAGWEAALLACQVREARRGNLELDGPSWM